MPFLLTFPLCPDVIGTYVLAYVKPEELGILRHSNLELALLLKTNVHCPLYLDKHNHTDILACLNLYALCDSNLVTLEGLWHNSDTIFI